MSTFLLTVKKYEPNPKAGERIYGGGTYGPDVQPDTIETRSMEVSLTEHEFNRLRFALIEGWDLENE